MKNFFESILWQLAGFWKKTFGIDLKNIPNAKKRITEIKSVARTISSLDIQIIIIIIWIKSYLSFIPYKTIFADTWKPKLKWEIRNIKIAIY